MSPREVTFVAHARSLAALHGPGPWPHGGNPLPDEEPREPGKFPLYEVVFEGVSAHHFGTGSRLEVELAEQIRTHLDDPAYLLELFAAVQDASVADDLVRELRSRSVSREKLGRAARFVTENATRREVAKLGIVLLGAFGAHRDRELLQLLGALDEFALFAAVALLHTQPDPQRAVFELAQRLAGWGRIHAVERLEGCTDPDIRAWLLRSGFRNGVRKGYLAHLAATTGGLYPALRADTIDDALLDGAADILSALANGGPTQDMHDYDDAVPAMHRFAEHVARAAPTIGRLDAALTLRELVSGDDFDWPDGEPARLRARYTSLAAQDRWRDLLQRELGPRVAVDEPTTEPAAFELALSCAGRLGMDVFSHALARLRTDPVNSTIWQWAMGHAGKDVAQVAELAEQLLPLRELASGPTTESWGLGRDFVTDMALGIVVRNLREHPGVGGKLLPVALANRIIRCRRAALEVLAAWPPQARPPEARDWLAAAAAREPNAELRQDMLAFLAAELR